jgi:very-short-patch-repair endonuclease
MDHHDMYELARRQHGLIAGAQLASMGCSEKAIRHLRERGRLERLSARVYRIAGSAETLQQRRLAAVLDAGEGAALSHTAANAAWGVGRRASVMDVIRPRRGNAPRTSLGRVHEARELFDHHVVVRHGVPITTPARTIVDLAATGHPAAIARLLDTAWSRRLLNIGGVANVVAEVRDRGRSGVRLLDELIEERKLLPRPGSALEIRFESIVHRRGLPTLRRQVHISDDEGWIGCVDFVAGDLPLVFFVDGDAFHSSLTDRRHDDRQTRRLNAAGYLVERFSDAHVLFDEPRVARLAHHAFVLARESAPGGAESRARTDDRPERDAAAA